MTEARLTREAAVVTHTQDPDEIAARLNRSSAAVLHTQDTGVIHTRISRVAAVVLISRPMHIDAIDDPAVS